MSRNEPATRSVPTTPPGTPAIETEDLTRRFGSFTAVDGISLTIPAGAVYGVLGPNGAGKSTLLRVVTTLLAPTSGHARVLGHDVVREAHTVRSLIGVTGQDASVDETLTGSENLRLFGRLTGLGRRRARTRADELLEAFSLTEAATKPIGTYSGGMRRRLDLAVSLIGRPPVVFLDEPTTGLDPRTRGQMWDVVRDLVAQGSTVLLTTQYLEEADQLSARLAIIDRGRLVIEGTPDQLKDRVGTTSLVLTAADGAGLGRMGDVVARVTGTAPHRDDDGHRLQVPLTDTGLTADVLTALREAGLTPAAVSMTRPSLDSVFLALTGHRAPGDDAPAGPGAVPATDHHTTTTAEELA